MDKKEISKERKNYLKKKNQKKISILLTQIFILVIFLALWEFLANKKIIDSFITSQPSRILNTFINLNSNNLLEHIGVTVYETVQKEIKKDLPSRLHARRQMLKVLYPVTEVPTEAAGKKANTKKVDLTAKLFDEYAPKYAERNGGYTRIVKIAQRKGDAALKVVLELV